LHNRIILEIKGVNSFLMKEYKVKEHGIGSYFGLEEIKEIERVLSTAETLAYGPQRNKFENEFANYCGAKYAIATTSATTALHLTSQLLQLKSGDEIIGTPQTFRATYLSALSRGVKIKFADINGETLNIDPSKIEHLITPKTKAIYVMDYGGNPAEIDKIMEIAKKYNILVVDDAAHAPGAEYKSQKVGSIADITCFSFHSLKNMTTLGEGGMLTTNNPDFMKVAKQLREMDVVGEKIERDDCTIGPYNPLNPSVYDHSMESFTHDFIKINEWGNNFRMSEVQAAVGSVQLKKLDDLNKMRTKIAEHYTEALSKIEGVRVPKTTPKAENVWLLYPCYLDTNIVKCRRNEFIYYLENKGIQIVQRFFPVHLSDYMRYFGHRYGECPVCERIWFEEQINLPINPRLSFEDVNYVVDAIDSAVKYFKK
jgi:perosamine synthetase